VESGSEFRVRQTVGITRRLRSLGYPAPEFVAAGGDTGVRYLVQRMLPGSPCARLTPTLLERLTELNRLQENAAPEFAERWPARIMESVEKGFEEWCVHESLATYSPQTASMLAELKRTASLVATAPFQTVDAVHFDFSAANILVENGQVSGVIDWNGCCAGDRAFDLVTLAFYALEDADLASWLLDRACEVSSPPAVSLYLSHMILRQLDWSIRHHDQTNVERYLSVSRNALRVIQEFRERSQ